MLREEYTKQATQAILLEHERRISDVMNDLLPGWTVDDLSARCLIQRVAGSPIETLFFDGQPVMEWWPVEFSEPQRTNEGYRINITRKFRRLPSQVGGSDV